MSEQIADLFIEALGKLETKRELEPLLAAFAERCEISNVVVSDKFQGREGARSFWTNYRETFDEMKSIFRSRIVSGDSIALEWSTEGTIKGGLFIRYEGVSILEVESSTIVRFRTYFDAGSLSRQMKGTEKAALRPPRTLTMPPAKETVEAPEREVTQRNVRTVAEIEKAASEERTWGERFVDGVATLVGNERFFGLHALWIGGWILLNSGIVPGVGAFDPYPWENLRAVLSLEAILIACTVLMIQGRMKQQNARQSHLRANRHAGGSRGHKTLELVQALCRERGLTEQNDPELAALIQQTEHNKLMDEVEDKLVAD